MGRNLSDTKVGMQNIRAWLIAVYVPDYIEWKVCASVEREWLNQRARWRTVDSNLDLRIVCAKPFANRRKAEKYKSQILQLSPQLRFNLISEENPAWHNLLDNPALLAIFRSTAQDDDGEEGGAAALLPRPPEDPLLTRGLAAAEPWPATEDWDDANPCAPGRIDPEERLLRRLG